MVKKKSCYVSLVVLALIAVVSQQQLHAQSANLIRQFTTLNGTIDFLPGAWVSVWEDGHSTYYEFKGGRFVEAEKLPALIRGWEDFGWDDEVDSSDQIARADYDPDINEFLPKQKKVKKVIRLSLPPHGSKDLVLVCFTLPAADPLASSGDTDIYITALLLKQQASGSTYEKFWTLEMEAGASYGEMKVQDIPSLGRFIVLYWGYATGSGTNQGLNVYRLTD